MKKRLFLLLTCLLTLALTASAEVSLPKVTAIDASAFEGDSALKGRVVLPASVETIGSRAFAGTGLHALVVPAGCSNVAGNVLADTEAAYLHLKGASTIIDDRLTGVAYVFGPAFGTASAYANFYADDTLVTQGGFYYSVTDGDAVPLCAVDGASISGEVTVPKLVSGQPVRSVDTLIVNGCDNLSGIRVPAYLDMPAHLEVSTYRTMTADAPVPSATAAEAGDTVTWTVSSTGAYGEVTYVWTFTTEDFTETLTTAEPSVDYTFSRTGSCVVSVTVTDELGDHASAAADGFDVSGTETVYRALLVANTYPDTATAHPGSDNDVAGMRTMLGKMTATPYRISTQSNLSADGMVSAIRNTFAGAKASDVSLFYFSGRGTNAADTSFHGALLGTGTTYLTVSRLRSVLDEIPGKKIIILDSHHSGQMIGRSGGLSAVSKADLNAFNSKVVAAFSARSKSADNLAESGYYVITAAHSTEDRVSTGIDTNNDGTIDKLLGLFTYNLCTGSGWNMATGKYGSLYADSDGDGAITLYEAYSYARYKTLQSNPGQTAQMYPSNSSMIIWAK